MTGVKSDYDVAIVGAGVAGALVAARLVARSIKVVLLDAGPGDADRLAMVGSFASSRNRMPHDPYRDAMAQEEAPSPRVDDGATEGHYLQATPDTPFKSTYQRIVGGSTWHFLGNMPRFLPVDFRLHQKYGVGSDWPIDYAELEPWYCEAEKETGVSGNHVEWDGLGGGDRSQPFPMPPIWPAYGDGVVKRSLDGAVLDDVEVKIRVTPQARNSVPFQGRPSCAGNSSCVPICPIQAKYDATVHVAMARKGGCTILPRAVVHRLVTDDSGAVTAIDYSRWSSDGLTREAGQIKARLVIVAAHAIETPLILLNSGIATSSPVGRCLMDHLQGYGLALMPEPVYPFRGPPVVSGIDAWRDGAWRKDHAAFRISIGNDGWGRPEPLEKTARDFIGQGFWGKKLRDAIAKRATHMLRFSYSTEMLPDSVNRVELAQGGAPDRLKPKISFSLPEYNQRAFDVANDLFSRMFGIMGAGDTRFTWPGSAYSGAGHIMGTCRMGTSPHHSVTDADCRVHGSANLFLAGAALFPTCGTANPTLTLSALALRLADHIGATLPKLP